MLQADTSALAAGATLAGVTVVAQPMVPVLGVPLALLLAACAGALVGLGHSQPDPPKWAVIQPLDSPLIRGFRIAGQAAALMVALVIIAVVAAWTVVVAPHIPGFGWTATLPPMPAAGLVAAGGQYFFPKLIAAGGRYLDKSGG